MGVLSLSDAGDLFSPDTPYWGQNNTRSEVLWDSGNAVYKLYADTENPGLSISPESTLSGRSAWVLASNGSYLHDPQAAHLYREGLLVREAGSTQEYRVLEGATVAELIMAPSVSAGYSAT